MAQLNKILIIRFSSIGDIILASPLICALRLAYPDALIDAAVKSEYAELLKYNPHLSAVFELKTSSFGELREFKAKIKSEQYDVILDIHNSLRSRYVRMFSRARTFAIDKRLMKRFALVHLKRNYYKDVVPVVERYFETARSLGIDNRGNRLEIFVPEDVELAVNAKLGKYLSHKNELVVGFAASAKHMTKRWPSERYIELGVRMAYDLRAKILLFGGKDEKEYCGDITQMMNAQIGYSAAENLAGELSLLENAAALDRCNVVVTNDTGLMHLAAARKRKIVAIFGSTVKEFGFFPYGSEHIVVENAGLYCRPCSHIGLDRCPEGHFRCLKDISVEQVYSAVQQILHSSPVQEGIRP